jgi:DNA-binding XRE family transcriptional regulator
LSPQTNRAQARERIYEYLRQYGLAHLKAVEKHTKLDEALIRLVLSEDGIPAGRIYTCTETAEMLGITTSSVQRIALRLDLGRQKGPTYPRLLSSGDIDAIREFRRLHPVGPGRDVERFEKMPDFPGKRLRQYRELAGLNQAALADAAQVSKQTISQIETGKIKKIKPAFAEIFAQVLDVDVDVFTVD